MGNEGVVEWRVRCSKGCTSGSGFETGSGGCVGGCGAVGLRCGIQVLEILGVFSAGDKHAAL